MVLQITLYSNLDATLCSLHGDAGRNFEWKQQTWCEHECDTERSDFEQVNDQPKQNEEHLPENRLVLYWRGQGLKSLTQTRKP